ncbi:synaptotagmin-5 [Procambarus clarkii]|uniref:synaptotagmin-5 n=1 Tax=Procambarus clarkii TaxID=6728 RepID=UPI001E670969|nr:synaptotagmin-1-like isoform X2 [Procambarus clarkii]
MYTLTAWGRFGVMVAGACVVGVAVVVVVCVVAHGCWLNTLLLDDEERRRREKERQSIYMGEAPTLRLTTYAKSPSDPTPDLALTPGQTPTHTKYTYISPIHGTAETNSLLGALSSKRDSTYSSMSEYSGRTSPTNSCRSSVGDSVGSGVGSPVGGEAQGHLSFGVQYIVTSPEANTGKLVITVLEARGLAGREYLGNACDPYVKVVVWRERRSIRKTKSPPLHVFRTRTVRHTQDPTFNQSFVIEASKSDLKELVVKLVAMDSDKWASPSTVGEVTQPLRDIKNLAILDHRTTLNYFLAPPKLDLGEVLFGLSYLPTAQRLSVSVIKAQNLKYSNVVDDLKDFCPYIRVLLISGSGRVMKKKKTTWRSNTASPVWNETLIFDLAQSQVEHVTFLLVLCTRPPQMAVTPTSSDASYHSANVLSDAGLALPDIGSSPVHDQNQNKKQDRYVGKVALGCSVRGEEQRQHWIAIIASPRKVVSQWHALK